MLTAMTVRNPSSVILRFIRTYSNKRKLLGVYDALPCELFRINSSDNVVLRDHDEQKAKGRSSYDLHLDKDGFVLPLTRIEFFVRPNGMSLRPNGPFLQEIIRGLNGPNVTIYKLPKGLELKSKGLTCIWEHSDHHSVQTTVPIKLDALNQKLSQLCNDEGERMTKSEFLEKYPFETCL